MVLAEGNVIGILCMCVISHFICVDRTSPLSQGVYNAYIVKNKDGTN